MFCKVKGKSPGITATDKTLWKSVAVVNEYDLAFIKPFQLMDLANDIMPPAIIGFAFGVTVINESDIVHLKSTRRIALVICARRISEKLA